MKVDIEVHLWEPATGLRGIEKTDHWGHDDGHVYEDDAIIYWWSDGNGGCACNRGMSLDRAVGQFKCKKDESFGCGHDCGHYPCEGRLIVIEKIIMNGRLIYEEDAEGERVEEEMVDLTIDGVKREIPLKDLGKVIDELEAGSAPGQV